jgi:hypothetical protein
MANTKPTKNDKFGEYYTKMEKANPKAPRKTTTNSNKRLLVDAKLLEMDLERELQKYL